MNMVYSSASDPVLTFVASLYIEGYRNGYMENVVRHSSTTKARLLHYFPPTEKDLVAATREDTFDSWCGTTTCQRFVNGSLIDLGEHVDHSTLTGMPFYNQLGLNV